MKIRAILVSCFFLSASLVIADDELVVPLNWSCIDKKQSWIDVLKDNLCIGIEIDEFHSSLEAFPKITHFARIFDKEVSEEERQICERSSPKEHFAINLTRRCLGYGKAKVKRSGNLKSDLKTLSRIIELRIESGKTEIGKVEVNETEILLIEVDE